MYCDVCIIINIQKLYKLKVTINLNKKNYNKLLIVKK